MTMYSVEPHPISSSSKKSIRKPSFPFSRHGVIRAKRVSPLVESHSRSERTYRTMLLGYVSVGRHIGHV